MGEESRHAHNEEERLPYEPDMIRIPAGAFLMGVDPDQEPFGGDEALVEEAYTGGWHGPQHRLYLPDYNIARTPVTNGQYAAFLQYTEYPRPKRWRSRTAPKGKEDFPIVYVSWHDALAYCRWLAEATGKPYHLPSEAEWEKAAFWEVGDRAGAEADGRRRRYPWGDRWEAERCNTAEGKVGKITPVDAYPDGASAYGLLDLAGNVWEWTRSLWGEDWYAPAFGYPYEAADGREDLEAEERVARVLRGGSFAYDRRFAQCAFRYKGFPQNYSDGIGFRVAYSAGGERDH